MKILLLCLKGFEMMEFSVFIDIMRWARDEANQNIEVITKVNEKMTQQNDKK